MSPLKSARVVETTQESSRTSAINAKIEESFVTVILNGILYNSIFSVSINVQRLGVRIKRLFSRGLKKSLQKIGSGILILLRKLFCLIASVVSYFTEPISTAHKESRTVKQAVAKKGRPSFSLAMKSFFMRSVHILLGYSTLVGRVISLVVPVAAIAFFLLTVNYFSNLSFAVLVENNGEMLGYISDEKIYEQAEREMQKRIIKAKDNQLPLYTTPTFKIVTVDNEKLLDTAELCNKVIMSSGAVIQEATGFYIDGVLQGATTEPQVLSAAMEKRLASFRTGQMGERVYFAKNIEMVPGLYPVSSVEEDVSKLTAIFTKEVSAEKLYTIVPNDNPTLIAAKNSITLDELIALNPTITERCMSGETVTLAHSVPFMPVRVSKTVSYDKTIPYTTEKIANENEYVGSQKVLREGKDGKVRETFSVVMQDGVEVERQLVSTLTLNAAVSEQLEVGMRLPLSNRSASLNSVGTGYMQWPVAGGYVSCAFRGYAGHTGMDIAARKGTAVYAADSGVVTRVKYDRTGYGYHIVIEHMNGYQTWYAHNSALLVEYGQEVKKGDVIARIGETGFATGPHLHFEVRRGKTTLDPANFISYGYT